MYELQKLLNKVVTKRESSNPPTNSASKPFPYCLCFTFLQVVL